MCASRDTRQFRAREIIFTSIAVCQRWVTRTGVYFFMFHRKSVILCDIDSNKNEFYRLNEPNCLHPERIQLTLPIAGLQSFSRTAINYKLNFFCSPALRRESACVYKRLLVKKCLRIQSNTQSRVETLLFDIWTRSRLARIVKLRSLVETSSYLFIRRPN